MIKTLLGVLQSFSPEFSLVKKKVTLR